MAHHFHAFHLVSLSPWPLFMGLSVFSSAVGGVCMFFGLSGCFLLALGAGSSVVVAVLWWRDVIREGMYLGDHSSVVVAGLRWGLILFIVSEVFFFVSFFWAFFHASLSPTGELGMVWPPVGIAVFNPFQIPLLNTGILLASGVSVTWAHHALIESSKEEGLWALGVTVGLGVYFSILQGFEYYEASFCMADCVYGSVFFLATGFHGLHVMVGSVILSTCFVRLFVGHFSYNHHFGFEVAAWYWHFVDVVWLFLYISIYWWGW